MKIHLYNYERIFNRQLALLKEDSISEKNKETILKFQRYQSLQDISVPRMVRVIISLRTIARETGKDFEDLTREDYEKFFSEKKREYSAETISTYKAIAKVFHKWLSGADSYPECVRWIKRKDSACTKLPEDMLTQEDIKLMIKHAKLARDKALIASLWESGARIGELGTILLKNVTFDKFGCQMLVDGKTGMRRIRLINSAPYLLDWINLHPGNKNREAPLWVNLKFNRLECMGHRNIMKIIEYSANRAGIKKPVNPHHFRHSRATYVANHLTEAQMKEYFGWVQSSKMAARYVHLSGKHVDNAILRMHGLVQEDKEEDILKREPCPRCKELNDVNNEYCAKCWLPLSAEAHREIQTNEQKDQEGVVTVMKLLQLAQSDPQKVKEAMVMLERQG